MKKFKIVITDFEYSSLDIERGVFAQLDDYEFVTAQCRTEEEVVEAAADADAILNQYAPIGASVIRRLTNCKVISRYGVGVNTVDLGAATERGILVSNCTDYCVDEVADHAFALLLASARKVAVLNSAVKAGVWDYKRAVPIYRLRGKVLGLVGYGKIPQNLGRKAQAFGLKVVAYDPYVSAEAMQAEGVEKAELDALCRESDFVSVHAPLTAGTKGLIGKEQLALMKREAFIINTSRGPLIDEAELAKALQASSIAGAALDVLEQEPIPEGHPFLTMDQVILNPHTAWYSEESESELKRKIAQNVVDVLQGYFPKYVANPEVKAKLSLQER